MMVVPAGVIERLVPFAASVVNCCVCMSVRAAVRGVILVNNCPVVTFKTEESADTLGGVDLSKAATW